MLKGLVGVSEVSLGKSGQISGTIVAFDSERLQVPDLLRAFAKLPSFYKGFFVPTPVENWRG